MFNGYMFIIKESGIYKSLYLTVIGEAQIQIPSFVISSDWRWDVRMVPGWIIWFRFSVGLTFGWRKWNSFRLWYSMVEVSTVQWITCEEVQVHNIHTRCKENLHLSLTGLTLVPKGVAYAGCKLYNHLPPQIQKISNNVALFKTTLKKFLLQYVFYSTDEYCQQNYNDYDC